MTLICAISPVFLNQPAVMLPTARCLSLRQSWSREVWSRVIVCSSTCRWYRKRSSPCWLLLVLAPSTRSSLVDSPPKNSLLGSTMHRWYILAYTAGMDFW